ncbi:peptidyl-prolyl cis-trans isomerase-like 4 [Sylvia borin]
MAVLLETTVGDLVIDLYTEERPRTCLNFLKLCKVKYYNYCLIYNVQRDFMIQTGDPVGTGHGGESIFCQLYGDQARFFEAEKVPRIKHKKKGTVSMVNNGSDQHGSQFLITTGENLDYLDGVHTVFGEVTEGMDVLMTINKTFVDKDFIPYQDIRINHTVILDDPFDDPPGLCVPDRSPEPTKEQLDSGRIGADEEIDDMKGRSADEIEEVQAEKEAKTRAVLLEMVGDLPHADIKPPENVLFVCKLNPVTTAENLEIIFSRFGPIQSCEVIRDWKTGESLCYAFIEFEKEEDCEKAYFKMDNVLIDDRRIHVDFSQSVAKIKWKGKGERYTKEDFKDYKKEHKCGQGVMAVSALSNLGVPDASVESKEEEEPGPAMVVEQRREQQLRRFQELQMKRYEACKLNRQEVVEEDKRLKLPPNWEAKKARLEREMQVQEKKKECAAGGEDYERVKLLEISAEDAEKWERKKRKKNPDVGFSDYAAAQLRQYQRLTRQIKPDLEQYEKLKEQYGEALYPTSDSLLHGTHVPSKEGVDRMVVDLEKQMEKRKKYSRRRPYNDDAVIDYINERNAKFNQKGERFYGKYTAEIKQNLERGTVV